MAARDEPYVGLWAFDSSDQDRFYGRDDESRDVSALWRSNRLLVVHGPSGVGKTSLLQAGVISGVDGATADVLPVGRVSYGSGSDREQRPGLNPLGFALLSSWSPQERLAHLVNLSLSDFLGRRRVRTDRHGQPLPILAAIDQFEELLSGHPHHELHADEFLDQLAAALEAVANLQLLISIREDALVELSSRLDALTAGARAQFPLRSLTQDAALEAVTRPLHGTGRTFAPTVAESLVADLRIGSASADAVDPMQLQLVCAALWHALPAHVTTITDDHRGHHGNAEDVLTQFYTHALAEVARDYQVPYGDLAGWLLRSFVTEQGGRRIVYEGVSDTAGMPNSIARALADRQIIRSESRAGSCWYELQHDRLIKPVNRAGPRRDAGEGSQATAADHLRLAQSALATGDLGRARERAEEVLRVGDGDDPRILAEAEAFLGNLACQSGQLAEAERHYRQAAELFEVIQDKSAVGHALAAIGQLLLARRPYADAVDVLHAAVVRLPGNVDVQLELARALWFSGDLGAAAAVSGGVLTTAPDAAEALAGRGQILVERDDPMSALEDLDHLLRRHPDVGRRAEVRAARALALAQLGRIEEASAEADTAVADEPDSGPVLLRASEVVRVAGEQARADELLRRARDAQDPQLFPHQLIKADRLLAESRQRVAERSHSEG